MVNKGKYSSVNFPRVARGHSKYRCKCVKFQDLTPTSEAKYVVDKKTKESSYLDGHWQSQDVAERSHNEGIR